jgi:hypothetical protein
MIKRRPKRKKHYNLHRFAEREERRKWDDWATVQADTIMKEMDKMIIDEIVKRVRVE